MWTIGRAPRGLSRRETGTQRGKKFENKGTSNVSYCVFNKHVTTLVDFTAVQRVNIRKKHQKEI